MPTLTVNLVDLRTRSSIALVTFSADERAMRRQRPLDWAKGRIDTFLSYVAPSAPALVFRQLQAYQAQLEALQVGYNVTIELAIERPSAAPVVGQNGGGDVSVRVERDRCQAVLQAVEQALREWDMDLPPKPGRQEYVDTIQKMTTQLEQQRQYLRAVQVELSAVLDTITCDNCGTVEIPDDMATLVASPTTYATAVKRLGEMLLSCRGTIQDLQEQVLKSSTEESVAVRSEREDQIEGTGPRKRTPGSNREPAKAPPKWGV